jgi:hypothetical protein
MARVVSTATVRPSRVFRWQTLEIDEELPAPEAEQEETIRTAIVDRT